MTLESMLNYVDIFYNLEPEQLQRVAAVCREVVLNQGTVIFEENSQGDEMYIVVRGAVDIHLDPSMLGIETNAAPKTIATLRKGQVFGEVVMVDQGLRSAGARVAADHTQLLIIRRADLIALCETDYKLGYQIMRNIAAELAYKIRSADLMVREQMLWSPSPDQGT